MDAPVITKRQGSGNDTQSLICDNFGCYNYSPVSTLSIHPFELEVMRNHKYLSMARSKG